MGRLTIPPTALTSVQSSELLKLDSAAATGLTGTANSIAYRAHEIERHLHGYERWFGLAVTPSGETHVADAIGTTTTPFRLDAGNLTWGAWVQILGSADTPFISGQVKFDLHEFEIVDRERASATHFFRFAGGTSGAAGLAAGTYSEVVWRSGGAQDRAQAMPFMDRRYSAGTKLWAQVLAVGQNTGWVDVWFGLHEYEG